MHSNIHFPYAYILPSLPYPFIPSHSNSLLFAVYIFTYLTIYIFMWTGFLFFSDLFKLDTINSQKWPSSHWAILLFFYSIPSLLHQLWGEKWGGIGDLLGTPSFKDNYLLVLYEDTLLWDIFHIFHLIIVMIFANVFLGLGCILRAERGHNLWEYVISYVIYIWKDENEYNLMENKIMSSISDYNLSRIPNAENEDED